MNGKGTFHYNSGAIYEVKTSIIGVLQCQGEWIDNKYEGYGKYKFPDNSIYEGQWHENKYKCFNIELTIECMALGALQM